MALQTDIQSERGIVYPNQYVRVDEIRARKTEMAVDAGVYLTQQQAADGLPPHRIESFFNVPFDMDAEDNAWQQAYAFLKARYPEALDV
jgi:hypothetical protein